MIKNTKSTLINKLLQHLFAEIVRSILDIITWIFIIFYLLCKYYFYFATMIFVILVAYQLNQCVDSKFGEILDSLVNIKIVSIWKCVKNIVLNDS